MLQIEKVIQEEHVLEFKDDQDKDTALLEIGRLYLVGEDSKELEDREGTCKDVEKCLETINK